MASHTSRSRITSSPLMRALVSNCGNTISRITEVIYWGTGNANPVFAGQSRKGANLYTASIVALDADTGKLRWYFQASPHDTHDWDNVETPVLFDATIDGKPRKLLAQGARAGWFFLLDRTNGKNLVSKPFAGNGNWSKGVD